MASTSTTSGKLKVVAYADLGGLGSKQGAPVVYDWVAPSVIPQALPWLAVLALLLLKRNRCASAWWVCAPLVVVSGLSFVWQPVLEFFPSSQLEMFLAWISALGFGLAAVWLLSGYLGWKHRMLGFMGILLAQAGFSFLAYALGHGLELETAAMAIPLALSALVVSVAMSLAGLACRGRQGWVRLSLWLLAALAVVWLLVIGPFFLFALAMREGNFPMMVLFAIEGTAVGITFGVLLPFLVLSFANGFYGERLRGLLHLGAEAVPPVITPPMPATVEAAGS